MSHFINVYDIIDVIFCNLCIYGICVYYMIDVIFELLILQILNKHLTKQILKSRMKLSADFNSSNCPMRMMTLEQWNLL